jgi:hypothetical protein
MTLVLSLLLACGGKDAAPADSAPSDTSEPADTSDSSGSVDTAPEPECNRRNEGCGPNNRDCQGEGVDMLPGSNCLSCHFEGAGGGNRVPAWTAGGTVFTDIYGTMPSVGTVVRITDANGRLTTLRTSRTGNFYTAIPLVMPIRAEVETADGQVRTMASAVSSAACNTCHSCDGSAGGKLYAN